MLKFASADQLLDICYERDASDIHIVPNEPATLRLHGRLVRLEEYGELSPADTERLFREVAPPARDSRAGARAHCRLWLHPP
jgi:Tfp pilus assembly pilus retraction ATPase PilT